MGSGQIFRMTCTLLSTPSSVHDHAHAHTPNGKTGYYCCHTREDLRLVPARVQHLPRAGGVKFSALKRAVLSCFSHPETYTGPKSQDACNAHAWPYLALVPCLSQEISMELECLMKPVDDTWALFGKRQQRPTV